MHGCCGVCHWSPEDKRAWNMFVSPLEQGAETPVLSQSLDDLGTTWGECLGRTQWSSLLDLATYLYYFTSGCVPIITWSHDLPEHSMITWPCHMIWLPNLPCYLYLDPIIWLDVRDQIFECIENSFLSGALIITGGDGTCGGGVFGMGGGKGLATSYVSCCSWAVRTASVVLILFLEAFCLFISSWRWYCRYPKALATPWGVSGGNDIWRAEFSEGCKGTSRVMLSKFWGSDLLVAQW